MIPERFADGKIWFLDEVSDHEEIIENIEKEGRKG
jgi:hypothetical protein